jgi:hypothetical protein
MEVNVSTYKTVMFVRIYVDEFLDLILTYCTAYTYCQCCCSVHSSLMDVRQALWKHRRRCTSVQNAGGMSNLLDYSASWGIRFTYRVIQDENVIFWEVTVSVIVRKEVHLNLCVVMNFFRDRSV